MFNYTISNCVRILTRPDGMPYSDYIKNINSIKFSSIIWRAASVKIADLKFNIKESECRKLNSYEKQRLDKYRLALYILEDTALIH